MNRVEQAKIKKNSSSSLVDNTKPISKQAALFSKSDDKMSAANNQRQRQQNLDIDESYADADQQANSANNRRRIVQTLIDILVILIIIVAFGFVFLFLNPNIRHFTCDDTDIMFPYKNDTVAFWVVGIYGILGPIVFIIFVELINARLLFDTKKNSTSKRTKWRQFTICTVHAISLFALGVAITLLLTEVGKRWIGRLRPHFYSVCKPDVTKINCTINTASGFLYNPIYTGDGFCTGDPAKIKEARYSFPSGHSSFSSYTMLFLIIYLEARLVLLTLRYVKPIFQMTAFIAAYVTALSRIPDHFHRGSDVIGGAILGIIIALFITLVVGRVLWEYKRKTPFYDFDLRSEKHENED